MSASPILELQELGKAFPSPGGNVRAVDSVTLSLGQSETLGLVGESGCGKTTLGRLALGLIPPTEGKVLFDGHDLATVGRAKAKELARRAQIIFQDPYSSLDPRMRAGAIVGEGLAIHGMNGGREGRSKRVAELLDMVGLSPEHARRFPHEFSGGQRQRLGIARALAVEPEVIVCDEAVSALDVSVQAQIVNLLDDLQKEFGLAYLFISHDLSVVRYLSDRVAAMYLGALVETGPAEEMYSNPLHPYTKALLSAVPTVDHGSSKARIVLDGDMPSPLDPPKGCPFHPRCPERIADGPDGPSPCDRLKPRLVSGGGPHPVACFLYQDPTKDGENGALSA